MITPANAIELVLAYKCQDPQYCSALILDAISAAGYIVINRESYIDLLTDCVKEYAGDGVK